MDLSKKRSVIDECADVYYENVKALPDDVRSKLSIYQLKEIFDAMVKPAIQAARDRDRG